MYIIGSTYCSNVVETQGIWYSTLDIVFFHIEKCYSWIVKYYGKQIFINHHRRNMDSMLQYFVVKASFHELWMWNLLNSHKVLSFD